MATNDDEIMMVVITCVNKSGHCWLHNCMSLSLTDPKKRKVDLSLVLKSRSKLVISLK